MGTLPTAGARSALCKRRYQGALSGIAASLIAVVALSCNGCAKKGFPEGGPADTTGPTILATQPATGEARVGRSAPFVVEFSEPIDREKFLANLFVSPPFTGTLDAQWEKDRVTVTWPESLRADVTYRVTIGANLTDRHNNPMIEPATVAFSTGDTLDGGQITGRVHRGAEGAGALEILAYRLDSTDGWDPTRPDYITTTAENGLFDLSNLPAARFRLLAVADRNRNHAPDPGEEVGIPAADVDLTLAVQPEPSRLFTSVYDTTTFSVKSGTVARDGAILVALTHPPDTITWNSAVFHVEDSVTGERVDAEVFRPLRARSSVVAVYSDAFKAGTVYRVRLDASRVGPATLRSESGLAAKTGACYVIWVPASDTLGPVVSHTILPAPGIALGPAWPIGLEFDKPVAMPDSAPLLQVVDSLGRTIPGRQEWADSRRLWFHPEQVWPETTLVLVVLDSTRINDRLGNRPPPQPFHWKFHPLTVSLMGAATCHVSTRNAALASHSCYIEARATTGKLTAIRTAPFDSVFEWGLPSGAWIVSGWIDLDSDRRWSPGGVSPFQFAEPRVVLTDTLYVRERFTVEDVLIRF